MTFRARDIGSQNPYRITFREGNVLCRGNMYSTQWKLGNRVSSNVFPPALLSAPLLPQRTLAPFVLLLVNVGPCFDRSLEAESTLFYEVI